MSTGPVSTGLKLLDEIRRGAAYTARLSPSRAGVPMLASATVRLLQPDNTVAWSGPATVASAAGSVVIPGTATENADPAVGWLLEWTYTLTDGSDDVALNPVDIVLYTVKPVATWADLVTRHKDLPRLTGSDLDDAQAKGDQAWIHIVQALRMRARRPCLIVDSGMLYEPHILYWLGLYFAGLATGGSASTDGERAADYFGRFDALWQTLTFELADESTWKRTGSRKGTRGPLWTGGTGTGQYRPIPTFTRP